MIKPQSIKVLLSVLMLCCAPAAAQVALGVYGADRVHDGTFVAVEGSSIFLRASANAGDTIGIFVAPIDKSGQPDYSAVIVLLLESKSAVGGVAGDFQVPEGLGGMSFQIIGAALNVFGEISVATATVAIEDQGG